MWFVEKVYTLVFCLHIYVCVWMLDPLEPELTDNCEL